MDGRMMRWTTTAELIRKYVGWDMAFKYEEQKMKLEEILNRGQERAEFLGLVSLRVQESGFCFAKIYRADDVHRLLGGAFEWFGAKGQSTDERFMGNWHSQKDSNSTHAGLFLGVKELPKDTPEILLQWAVDSYEKSHSELKPIFSSQFYERAKKLLESK